MKKQQLEKLKSAHDKIPIYFKVHHRCETDQNTFQNDQKDIEQFNKELAPLGFSKLNISYDNQWTNGTTIKADLYNSKRGIRIQLKIIYTATWPSKIDRTLVYDISIRQNTTYKQYAHIPTSDNQTDENTTYNNIKNILTKELTTYQRTEKPTTNIDNLWRTANPQETTIENTKITKHSILISAKTNGICTIDHKNKITNDIENPQQTTYFHTIATDRKDRKLNFITDERTDRFLIATQRGENLLIEQQNILYPGQHQIDITKNITTNDLNLINEAVKLWLKHAN